MNKLLNLIRDRKGAEYGEIAVVLVVLVLAGVLAFTNLGSRIVQLINQVAAGV